MNNTQSRNGSQSGQIPLSGPGYVGAAYHDERARNPDDAFRLYFMTSRAPLRGAAKGVYKTLAHHADYRTGQTRYPLSVGVIAFETGIAERTAQLAIRKLEAAGYIERLESEHPGSREHGANRYRIILNPPLRAV